jgi:hypothetical protein
MKRAANKTICTEFKAINVIISGYQHSMKKYLPRVFKFYQPKATGGGFLIFEWTLVFCYCLRSICGNFLTYFYVRKLVLKYDNAITMHFWPIFSHLESSIVQIQ